MINTAVDAEYTTYITSPSTKKSYRDIGRQVKNFVLETGNEEGDSWFEINFFLNVVEPLFLLVRLADGTKPQAAQLYYRLSNAFKELTEELRTDPELASIKARLAPLEEALAKRRAYMHSPVHGAAFLCHPENYGKDAGDMDDGRPLTDLRIMAERILVLSEIHNGWRCRHCTDPGRGGGCGEVHDSVR